MKIYNAGNRVVNTYLYPIADGFVMIDTGYDYGFARFAQKLSQYHIDLKSIKYVFLTHAHDDHAGFLNELLSKHPSLKVVMSDQSLPVLKNGQNPFCGGCSGRFSLLFCNMMKWFGRGQHRFPAIEEKFFGRLVAVTDKNRHKLEKALQGKIIHTPGHTADSLSLLVDHMLFCGDAAMNGIPSFHRITIWIENKTAYKNTWKRIISLNPKTIYPSHGKPFKCRDLQKNIYKIGKIKLYPLSATK